jgi:glycosyltransferase involved in cell wall biosynthesis
MNEILPLISIIIPTKNVEKNIERCLNSIFNNNYKNVEVIIVDQGSTDQTLNICKNFDLKIIEVSPTKEYLPPSNSRNLGFKESRGDYIYHLDADMELQPTLLHEIYEIFKNPEIVAIVVPEKDMAINFWARAKAFERSLYENTLVEAARVSRRKIFEKTMYNTEIFSGEDWSIHDEFKRNGRISRTNSFVIHHLGSISLKSEFYKKLSYGKGSSKFVEIKRSELSTLKSELVKIYFYGVLKNFFNKPLTVLSFIIIRLVDLLALFIGLLKYNIKK